MKKKFPKYPIVVCFAIFIVLGMPRVNAQSQSIPGSADRVTQKSSGFTKVVDSKIDRSDTDVVRNLIALSDHSDILKNMLDPTIYIMDLDHFRDGMDDFMVFGKMVRILSKYEVIESNAPYYLTISGYNKKEDSCTAVVTMHSLVDDRNQNVASSVSIKKQVDTWKSTPVNYTK